MTRLLSGHWRFLLIAAVLVVLAIVPLMNSIYYTNLLITIAIHSIVAVGLCLLMGFAGQVSLGHAAFYGMGAFGSAILSTRFGLPPWSTIILAALFTALIAYLIGIPIFRLKGHYLAMATLGLGIIVYILFLELQDYTGGPSGLRGIPPLELFGLSFDTDFKFYYLVWPVCLLLLVIANNIVNSRVGRSLRALHGSEAAVEAAGINVNQLKVQVFVISAVYASLAGSLYAHYISFISPQPFGFMASIRMVVMVVVGGLASVWGAVFGAGTVNLLSEVLQPFGDFDVIVFGLILMAVMMFWPQGLTRATVDLVVMVRARVRQRREMAA